MQFVPKNTVPIKASASLNTKEIVEVSHYKFLGLKIDYVLSWNKHIDSVINKLTTVCFMLRSVMPYMTQSSLVNIYVLCFIQYFHMVLYFGGRQPTPRSSLYYKKGSQLNDRVWVPAFMSKPLQSAWNLTVKVTVDLFGFAVCF
jgi:hypothetical protein